MSDIMFKTRVVMSGFSSVNVLLACISIISVGTFLGYFAYKHSNTPPPDFPINTEVVIEEGTTARSTTELLGDLHIIRSPLLAYLYIQKSQHTSFIQAGSYTFDTPLTMAEIVQALIEGTHRTPLVKVMLPEGFRARNIHKYLPDTFATIATTTLEVQEGYLFPDTYHISSKTTAEEFLTLLHTTYEKRIAPYRDQIAASGLTEKDVIILASILEREANDQNSMRMVSAILQNRLHKNMPLQVDATFDYIFNKQSSELTATDLQTDSPYNLYLHTGLPPTPIANPGIAAIEAVLNPIKTDSLYYLTGNDGNFHYAKTFDEHKRNKLKYLE